MLSVSPTGDGVLRRLAGSLLSVGVAVPLAGVSILTTLDRRFRWLSAAGAALTAILALLAFSAIWGGWDSGGFWRAVGVVAVLLAAVLVVPPVARLASRRAPAAPTVATQRIVVSPSCGAPLPSGKEPCGARGARFVVRFEGEPAPGAGVGRRV